MPFTQYACNTFLGEMFGKTDYVAPTTLYFGLSTTTPTTTGTGITEPVGNAYARVSVTNNTTNFPAPSAGSVKNGTPITFPQATGSWGTVTYFFVSDAASGGNILGYGALSASQTVSSGDTLSFAANALTISLS